MVELVIIIVSIIGIVFLFWMAGEFSKVAEMKGYPESKYYWISLLFPLGGYLLVIALPDRNQKEVQVTMTTEDMPVKQTEHVESDELPDL